ncbi:MAG: RNA 2',3'-cyclic phosphodiesterase [Candidatus Omnitrophica bacterium]|nr:RNA 2',3'-cyclic phosphodiesterase [Candidatus Omnitrophota bacterium]MBU1853464.1 RNA 2',3'-cyclic phosphodiesterase [Candidatus Omnitrophota bacterium]
MDTIRAFVAIEIDEPNKQKLSDLITQFKKSNTQIKWVTENQMHLTLKFLGNIDGSLVPNISEALKNISENFTQFNIKLSKIGAFPNLQRPRVIWIGIDKGKENVILLANSVETALERLNFAKEKREFKTHLTLGRVKSLKNISGLTKIISETGLQFQDEIKIDKLILFQSTLTPKGAIYTPLAESYLTKPM